MYSDRGIFFQLYVGEGLVQLHRQYAAVGIAHHKPYSTSLFCNIHGLEGIFPVHQEAVEEVLQVKDDFAAMIGQELDGFEDHLQICLGIYSQNFLGMGPGSFAHQCHIFGLCLKQGLEVRIFLCLVLRILCEAEGNHFGMVQLDLLHPLEVEGILLVG